MGAEVGQQERDKRKLPSQQLNDGHDLRKENGLPISDPGVRKRHAPCPVTIGHRKYPFRPQQKPASEAFHDLRIVEN